MQALPEKIKNEQVKLIYKQLPIMLIGSFVAAAALVAVSWGQVEQSRLIIWSCLIVGLALLRAVLCRFYWSKSHSPAVRQPRWDRLFLLGSVLTGILWGGAGVAFYLPGNTEYILFVIVLLAGLVASCAASSGAYMPAFYYFAVPAVVPFSLRMLLDGRGIFILLGFLTLFFLGICFIFVRTYHKNTLLLIRAQFENQDLLEQVRAEKQSAETSQRIAEQAMVEKNKFLAAASHDLRQPLHALGLFVGALRRETPTSQSPLLDSIQGSLGALNHLFNSLLDVSRLDAGVVNVAAKHASLDEVVQRLQDQYQAQISEQQLEFEVDCNNLVVYTDALLLERVLRNLLVNAINYTDQGKISIHCQSSEDAVDICIGDTGIGIPADETEAIFSEYYQLNNPERDRAKGLGLGLAIVRRLCDLMEIPISIDSTIGQGTRFHLRVANGRRDLIEAKGTTTGKVQFYNLAVLVIDDELSVLEGMDEILSGWGCRTLMAESAADAIAQIVKRDFIPDIIFSDYRLRENKTGIEAIEAVYEELNLKMPAVIITGDTSADLLKQAVANGYHLLHKPLLPATLNQALAEWADPERLADRVC